MKRNTIFLFILFLFTYLLSTISVLYTESFILFLAGMVIFILIICNSGFKFNYNKEDFKWNETILFYLIMKNWNRSLIRDNNIKMANFLLLSIQIQKYEIEWMKRNLEKIINKDYVVLTQITARRLEILASYKNIMKSEAKISGLRQLPIVPEVIPYGKKKDNIEEEESLYEKELKKAHPMYYELVYKQKNK